MTLSRSDLANKAKRRCLEVGDYWWKSIWFLRSIGDTPKDKLTLKQRNWLTALEQDLREA